MDVPREGQQSAKGKHTRHELYFYLLKLFLCSVEEIGSWLIKPRRTERPEARTEQQPPSADHLYSLPILYRTKISNY